MRELKSALGEGGILFSSNLRGNSEGGHGQGFSNFMEFEENEIYPKQNGFNVFDHYNRPYGNSREIQPWHTIVSQCEPLKRSFRR